MVWRFIIKRAFVRVFLTTVICSVSMFRCSDPSSGIVDVDEAVVSVYPENLDFGYVAVGNAADRTLRISNLGKESLQATMTGPVDPGFRIVGDTSRFISAGSFWDVVVRFGPDGVGNRLDTLTVVFDSAVPSKDVPLSGNGNEMPGIMDWVFVCGGSFQMGDTFGDGEDNQKPVHAVTVSDFFMGMTEVTVAQFKTFCDAVGRTMPPDPSWGWVDDHPVVYMSWYDARDFCAWAGGRLPTEAEWEWAARGGNMTRGTRYSGGENIDGVAWYSGNSRLQTQPVGRKSPNELGLYDMSGNVWEWCLDWYDPDYYNESPPTDPQGPADAVYRVMRGGSGYNRASDCSVAFRGRYLPECTESYFFGFRCARTP